MRPFLYAGIAAIGTYIGVRVFGWDIRWPMAAMYFFLLWVDAEWRLNGGRHSSTGRR